MNPTKRNVHPGRDGGGTGLSAGPWTRLADPFELTVLDQMLLRDLYHIAGAGRDWPLAVTLAALLRATREGHLCLELTAKGLPSNPGSETDAMDLNPWLAKFKEGLAQTRYGPLVAREDPDHYRPLVWVDRRNGALLYFHKYYFHSRRLQQRLLEYLEIAPHRMEESPTQEEILESLYQDKTVLRVGRESHPIARDNHQLEALQTALENQFTLISGGPGTGKTSLMVNLLRALVRWGVDPKAIILGAPTGRAAQRMTEAVGALLDSIAEPAAEDRALHGLTARTLHTILKYRPRTHGFHYNRQRPLSAQVVVLDESSMVDVVLMDQFLQALDPEHTRLVMLGDKDQLPAVEAGAVFAEMIPLEGGAGVFGGHLATLSTVFRSGKSLAVLAQGVNQGVWQAGPSVSFEDGLELEQDAWGWVETESVGQWRRAQGLWARRWYQTHGYGTGLPYPDLLEEARRHQSVDLLASPSGRQLLEQLFAVLEGVRILTLVRKGPFGCEDINLRMALNLADAMGRHPRRGWRGVFPGVPVLITRNDHRRKLYNGDVGLCLEDRTGLRQVFFRRGSDFTAWPEAILPPSEPAFAMTVHKSQGSEYGRVLLVLPDDPAQRLLSREILYTGITRARQTVLVYGSRAALDAALSRRIERISGLQWS